MSVVLRQLAVLVLALVAGWVALAPLRGRVWSPLYHLAAFPVGVLGLAFGPLATTALGRGHGLVPELVGLASFAAVTAAALAVSLRGAPRTAGRWLGEYVGWGGVFVVAAVLVLFAGVTGASNDSHMWYGPYGLLLADTARFTAAMIAARGHVLPAVHAAFASFGIEWPYSFYPMTAIAMLGALGAGMWRLLPVASARLRASIVAGTLGALCVSPVTLFMSVYVHSHIPSAGYLVLSVVALGIAAASAEDADACRPIAGLAAAGLVLVRPDGLAYAAVPASLMLVDWLRRRGELREVLAFFGPLLAVSWIAFGVPLVRFGLWHVPGKLGGATALAMLLGITLAPLAVVALSTFRRGPLAALAARPVAALGLVGAVAVTALALAKPVDLARTVSLMGSNLFVTGAQGWLWIFIAGAAAVTLLLGTWRDAGAWTRDLLLVVVEFLVVALLVHAATHVGRTGFGDSFNRVSFHVVPLAFWYLASVFGASASRLGRAGERGADESVRQAA